MPHNLISKILWYGLNLSPAVMFLVTATSKMGLKPIQPLFGVCITVTEVPGAGG
jgi:hypothetical protein